MKALVVTRHGPPGVLRLEERSSPDPRPDQLRVRVRFAGLNFADVQARVGLYPDAPKPPFVSGYECSGEIDAIGPQVSGWQLGERVMVMSRFGAQAEQVCVIPSQLQKLPESLPLEAAAALPVNFLTAHHLLHQVGRVRHGEKILIQQAAGGVGTAVIQLGKLAGLTMFGTASAAKHDRLRSMGLQHPIDYRTQDFRQEIERIAGPRPLQLALDPMGPDSWRKGYALLAPGGQLLVFGFSAIVEGPRRNLFKVISQALKIQKYSPLKIMGDNLSVGGVNMGAPIFWEHPELLLPQLQTLVRLAAEKAIAPIVDKAFPAAEAAQAHAYLQSRQSFGKVLLAF
jgi:NADPH:quinone reductase-like Zn-dependent oxidoreductase